MPQRSLLPVSLLAFLLLPCTDCFSSSSDRIHHDTYEAARVTKATHGHDAAMPLYRQILCEHPDDLTVASRLSAASGELFKCWQRGPVLHDDGSLGTMREWFQQSNYTAAAVKATLQITEPHTRAPIYITPASPGSCHSVPFETNRLSSHQLLVSLFLLGLAIPATRVSEEAEQQLEHLQTVGLIGRCEVDSTLWVPLVSILPLDMEDGTTLLIATDWHPQVLNTIHIAKNDQRQPVMYIGPDSLALVQHFILDAAACQLQYKRALDVCTGSGIQALAFVQPHPHRTAVVADINPRALQFTRFNAAFNDLSDQIEDYVLVDLVDDIAADRELLRFGPFDLILANPPFLPVPPSCLDRHGLFSGGGETGEVVLASILRICPQLLRYDGVLAVVSEFFLGDNNDSVGLLRRCQTYWGEQGGGSLGLLLINEKPIGRAEYARRRGDAAVWTQHLEEQGIFACSPGLLYVRLLSDDAPSNWEYVLVPNSKANGSLWTPWNHHAVAFTRSASSQYFRW